MNIPNFLQEKFVDPDGTLNESWSQILQQLLTELQQNAGQEGLVPPSLTSAQIALLTNSRNGTIVYNSDTDQFLGRVAGVWKTFTLT